MYFSKIRAAVSVPSGIGDVEKRAIEEVVISAGAKRYILLNHRCRRNRCRSRYKPSGYVIVDGRRNDRSCCCIIGRRSCPNQYGQQVTLLIMILFN